MFGLVLVRLDVRLALTLLKYLASSRGTSGGGRPSSLLAMSESWTGSMFCS